MRACVCGCECFHCVRFRRVKEKDRVGGELKRAIGLSFNVAITICHNRRVCLSVCVRASARLSACLHVCACVYTHNPVRIVCVGLHSIEQAHTSLTLSLTHSLTCTHMLHTHGPHKIFRGLLFAAGCLNRRRRNVKGKKCNLHLRFVLSTHSHTQTHRRTGTGTQ